MALFRSGRRAEAVASVLVAVSLFLVTLPEDRRDTVWARANHVMMLPAARLEKTFGGYLGLREENARLRADLERARLRVARTEPLVRENDELRRMLGFARDQPVRLVAARVIDRNFETLPTAFVIDAGRDDGVAPELPVVSAGGLVGKTVEVGPRTSRVMLYTHPEFSASALLVGGDHLEYGVVRPTSDGAMELFLPLRSSSTAGNRIVTSGYGGTFPRGIPLGRVVGVREDERLGLQKIDRVEPAVRLGRVSSVFVLARASVPGEAAGDVIGLFWPGYAYPPMAGEPLGRAAATADSLTPDSLASDSLATPEPGPGTVRP